MPRTSRSTSEWLRSTWALALPLALVAAGCSASTCDTSDDGNPPDRYIGGTVANGAYASSSWHGPLLHFPGGKRYDLVHGLGYTPTDVRVWLSFSPDGVGERVQGDSIAPAAGNAGELQLVNDTVIRVKNDSCAEFWLRVTASGDPRGARPVDALDGGTE